MIQKWDIWKLNRVNPHRNLIKGIKVSIIISIIENIMAKLASELPNCLLY